MEDIMSGENAIVYVNAYKESQAYGGPEEGGWYYHVGTVSKSETAECSCPIERVVMAQSHSEYMGDNVMRGDGEYSKHELQFSLKGWPDDHEETCPSRILAESWHRPKQKPYFPESYTTANGTWNPDSMEDAPEDYRGEIVTIDPNLVIRIEVSEGKDWPQYQPHWE